MTIYRIYYIDYEYIPSDYYDEDGYCDDYYDNWIEKDITVKYVDSLDKVNQFAMQNKEIDYQYEEIIVE